VICPEGWFKAFPGGAACDEVRLHTAASSSLAGGRILQCPPGQTSPADSTSLADCVCAPGFSPAGSTATTQDFVCKGAWQHAIQSELMTCMHANGSVLPFVHYDTLDPTEQMPCVQVTRADCQTAAATNAFHFSVHVNPDGNDMCFGVV